MSRTGLAAHQHRRRLYAEFEAMKTPEQRAEERQHSEELRARLIGPREPVMFDDLDPFGPVSVRTPERIEAGRLAQEQYRRYEAQSDEMRAQGEAQE